MQRRKETKKEMSLQSPFFESLRLLLLIRFSNDN